MDKRRSLTPLLRNISVCYGADRRLDPVPIHNPDFRGILDQVPTTLFRTIAQGPAGPEGPGDEPGPTAAAKPLHRKAARRAASGIRAETRMRAVPSPPKANYPF